MGAHNSTAKTTQHQATVIHHPDGSKTVHIGTPLGQSFAPVPMVPMGSQGNYGQSGLVPIVPKGGSTYGHNGLVPIGPNTGSNYGHSGLVPIVPKGGSNLGHNGLVPIGPMGGNDYGHNGLVPIVPKGQTVGNALQPVVGKSPYPAVAGCQVQDSGSWPMYCNTSLCSVPSGRYCCSQDGTNCSGACGNNPKINCPSSQYVYPCMGCAPQ